jgi:integrase
VKDEAFWDLLVALYESGARPGEIAKLTPANVNMDTGVIGWVRHKTARKTGRPRVIYMTPRLREVLERHLVGLGPDDYLFVGRKGNPWNKHSFHSRFKYLRRIQPELQGVVPFSYRSSYAKDALEEGIPEATMAELLGHTSTQMLYKHYSKLSKKVRHLREMAERAIGGASALPEAGAG